MWSKTHKKTTKDWGKRLLKSNMAKDPGPLKFVAALKETKKKPHSRANLHKKPTIISSINNKDKLLNITHFERDPDRVFMLAEVLIWILPIRAPNTQNPNCAWKVYFFPSENSRLRIGWFQSHSLSRHGCVTFKFRVTNIFKVVGHVRNTFNIKNTRKQWTSCI